MRRRAVPARHADLFDEPGIAREPGIADASSDAERLVAAAGRRRGVAANRPRRADAATAFGPLDGTAAPWPVQAPDDGGCTHAQTDDGPSTPSLPALPPPPAASDGPSPMPAELLTPGAWLLHGAAKAMAPALLAAIDTVVAAAPFRHMVTPRGFTMSVAMTCCGALGWVSDRRGYRYEPVDPRSGAPWPPMPQVLRTLAVAAAERAGFAGFAPDACLVNRYAPGARLSLHQDTDERDFSQPIVSVSLGLPATFLLGGDTRAAQALRLPLFHGDIVVWGGPARRRFHGVLPLRDGVHELLGGQRVNLTFRRAG